MAKLASLSLLTSLFIFSGYASAAPPTSAQGMTAYPEETWPKLIDKTLEIEMLDGTTRRGIMIGHDEKNVVLETTTGYIVLAEKDGVQQLRVLNEDLSSTPREEDVEGLPSADSRPIGESPVIESPVIESPEAAKLLKRKKFGKNLMIEGAVFLSIGALMQLGFLLEDPYLGVSPLGRGLITGGLVSLGGGLGLIIGGAVLYRSSKSKLAEIGITTKLSPAIGSVVLNRKFTPTFGVQLQF